jgi:hypothetical protein
LFEASPPHQNSGTGTPTGHHACVTSQDLLHVPAFLVRFTSHWDNGSYLDPDGVELATFESAGDRTSSLWCANVLDGDGRLALRVQERRADPLHNHDALDGKRIHHSFEVTDHAGASVGLVWSLSGVLGGRWLLQLDTADHNDELRASRRSAAWNPNTQYRELAFELRTAHAGGATVTARWSETKAPTDNISVEMSDGLARELRGLLAVIPLCLPHMGLTGTYEMLRGTPFRTGN